MFHSHFVIISYLLYHTKLCPFNFNIVHFCILYIYKYALHVKYIYSSIFLQTKFIFIIFFFIVFLIIIIIFSFYSLIHLHCTVLFNVLAKKENK